MHGHFLGDFDLCPLNNDLLLVTKFDEILGFPEYLASNLRILSDERDLFDECDELEDECEPPEPVFRGMV